MATRLLFTLICVLLPSCGYQVLQPSLGAGQSIWVPTATNHSHWHGMEASFTQSLRKELVGLWDLRLKENKDADLILTSHLRHIRRGAAVSGKGGTILAGRAYLQADWILTHANGAQLAEGSLSRTLEFLPQKGEDTYSAADKIIAELTEQIAMETGLSLRPSKF